MNAPETGRRPLPVIVHWLPALTVMAAIWGLSSIELPPGALRYIPLRDKGAHFLAYALLGFFVAHAAKRTWPTLHPFRIGLLAVWITLGWGVIDEMHQAFVPGRFADLMDVLADGIGAIAGTLLRYVIAPIVRCLTRCLTPRATPS